jgi:hypothetical protein
MIFSRGAPALHPASESNVLDEQVRVLDDEVRVLVGQVDVLDG